MVTPTLRLQTHFDLVVPM